MNGQQGRPDGEGLRIAAPNMTQYFQRRSIELRRIIESGKRLREPPLIELHPDEEWTARAFSRMRGTDVAEIHVHEGTYTLLADFFLRSLADRRNFPSIGEPGKELISEPTVQDLYWDVDHLLSSGPRGEDELTWVMPQCPVRRAAAQRLTEIALDAIVLHEATHIYHGHLALLERKPELTRAQRISLEQDADEGGTSRTLALLGQETMKRRAEGRLLPFCASHQDVARLVTIAAHSSLLLRIEFIRSAATFEDYPSIRERQAAMALIVTGHFAVRQVPAELMEAIGDAIVSAVFECEAAYANVTGNSSQAPSAAETMSDPSFLQSFSDGWREVRPLLEPFAYVPLPPPQPETPVL